MCNVNTEARSPITVAVEKHYFLLVCVRMRTCMWVPGAWAYTCAYEHVALLIQHTTSMRHTVTSFVAPQSAPHFSILSHKRCDFWKKLLNIKSVF